MRLNSTNLNKLFLALTSLALLVQSHLAFAGDSNIKSPDANHPNVKIETSKGDIIVELYPDKAPISVANFLSYVENGTYDGTIFHRVIKDFMNQGGGFTEDFKKVAAKDPIQNEADNGLKNLKNTIAMARTNAPHSATNQFFINTKDNAFLDHTKKSMRGWGYTVFGKVVEGGNIVGAISRVPTGASGPFSQDVPRTPIIIKKITKLKK